MRFTVIQENLSEQVKVLVNKLDEERIQHGGHIRSVADFVSLYHVRVIVKKPSDETWVQSGLIFLDIQFKGSLVKI